MRILQACHEMGKQVVAPYTQVDKHLKHLRFAEQSICIGKSSYLCIDDLITAAKISACDAIHPGYGFLSENAEFAAKAEDNGLVFIGPIAEQIKQLENKALVRQLMAAKGLQVIPGSEDSVLDLNEALNVAEKITYPVLMKASFGGGGRGIRLIQNRDQLSIAFSEARQEAQLNFGRGEVYLEKYLSQARHIEVQLLGDGTGSMVHLGTRDCSIQRRHQKLVEEAPAFGIDAESLNTLALKACDVLSSINYRSAATLEFLYQGGEFYFMEINVRLQVEHPVSEMISGIDIVKSQLSIADTGHLPFEQQDVSLRGCAIECRINAEDECFNASPGLIVSYDTPGGKGVRLDSHIYAGYDVPHHYDSLLAKLIVHGEDRQEAIAKMQRALSEIKIKGIATSIPVLANIVSRVEFVRGGYNIGLNVDGV